MLYSEFCLLHSVFSILVAASPHYEIHRDLVQKWKKIILDGSADLFSAKHVKGDKSNTKIVDELYKQIGQLKVENDWLKKNFKFFNKPKMISPEYY